MARMVPLPEGQIERTQKPQTWGGATSAESLSSLYASLPLTSSPQTRILKMRRLDSDEANLEEPQLQGKLSVVDLTDCPTFTALSYAWGDGQGKKRAITCNDTSIPITANCFNALHSICRVASTTLDGTNTSKEIPIWVDAICINQADDADKASQIPLMLDIYTWAHTTYIWLGPGNEASDTLYAG